LSAYDSVASGRERERKRGREIAEGEIEGEAVENTNNDGSQ
jgi:hypothetical protein